MIITSNEQFLSMVSPEPNSGCWLWDGQVNHAGYGQFHVKTEDGKLVTRRAHRFSYEMVHGGGSIPDGYHIDHLCSVRCCVNPDHLEPVTPRENVLRTHIRGRASKILRGAVKGNLEKTHCPHGHEYIGENIIRKGSRRACRECHRKDARERQRRKRDNVRQKI